MADTATQDPPADVHELRFGYNMADLERLTRIAANWARHSIVDARDRYATAWSAIAEALYAATERPDPYDLISTAKHALSRQLDIELHHHGAQRQTFAPAPRFAVYWEEVTRSAAGPEHTTVDRFALWQIWPRLTAHERAAVHALAVHGDQRAAAAALGVKYQTYASNLSRARNAFFKLWHEGEKPSRLWRNDRRGTVTPAHERAMRSLREGPRPFGTTARGTA